MRRAEIPSLIKRVIVAAAIAAPVFYLVYLDHRRNPPPGPPTVYVDIGDPAQFDIGGLSFSVPAAFLFGGQASASVEDIVDGRAVRRMQLIRAQVSEGKLIPRQTESKEWDDAPGLVNLTMEAVPPNRNSLSRKPPFPAYEENVGASNAPPGLTEHVQKNWPHTILYYGTALLAGETREVLLAPRIVWSFDKACGTYSPVTADRMIQISVAFGNPNCEGWREVFSAVFAFIDAYSVPKD